MKLIPNLNHCLGFDPLPIYNDFEPLLKERKQVPYKPFTMLKVVWAVIGIPHPLLSNTEQPLISKPYENSKILLHRSKIVIQTHQNIVNLFIKNHPHHSEKYV